MSLGVYQIVNSFFSSNTYILYRNESPYVWLVDCGDAAAIINWLGINNKTVKGVFLTHTHYDHIYGLNALREYESNLSVYTSANGIQGLASPKLNLSLFHDSSYTYDGSSMTLCQGDKIELYPDEYLNIYETPGHDWSCLSYLICGSLFTGDAYIPNVKVVANFPKSNRQQAKTSRNFLVELSLNCRCVYPGHGEYFLLI